VSDWKPVVLRRPGEDWERAERELDASGVPLPLPSRVAWARHVMRGNAWLIAAHDTQGRFGAALAIEIQGLRALPGHYQWRAHHIGRGIVGPAGDIVLRAIRDLALATPRVLAVNLEFILRDAGDHQHVAQTLSMLGFRPPPVGRSYVDTIVVPLKAAEEEILAGFSWSTRRELRQWSRQALELRAIENPGYAARLDELAREAFQRTGGDWNPRDWPARMQLGAAEPARSRLVGLFRQDGDDPSSLLAFAWGCAHGDFAHYDDGGSARVPDIRFRLACPLLWDLIRWARAGGCQWFDMGGVPPEGHDATGALKGIAEFKLRFSDVRARVGAEWQFDARPKRRMMVDRLRKIAQLARATSR
jgi:hypothetical protein